MGCGLLHEIRIEAGGHIADIRPAAGGDRQVIALQPDKAGMEEWRKARTCGYPQVCIEGRLEVAQDSLDDAADPPVALRWLEAANDGRLGL